MKFSFMSFSTPDLTLKDTICKAKKLGYDGIEVRINSNHKHNVQTDMTQEQIKETISILTDTDFSICCIATSCVFCNPETIEKNIQDAKDAVDLAVALSVPKIRVFGGGYDTSFEEVFGGVVSALSQISDYIGDRLVTICMETHDSWCDPNNVMKVIHAVDRKNVKVNWDIMHPVLTANKTIAEAFDILKGNIEHVHIHDGTKEDGKLLFAPIGKGDIDHHTALALLSKSNYTGYLSGEWIGWDEDHYLETELKTLKEIEASLCLK